MVELVVAFSNVFIHPPQKSWIKTDGWDDSKEEQMDGRLRD